MNITDFLIGYKAGMLKGGGSSADVRYVTFMSHDGAVEYGKKAVAVGDDCADPIARGVFDTPTKESTSQYDYSFVGWATTPNGAWDENALDTVTEDKIVYAAYAYTWADTNFATAQWSTIIEIAESGQASEYFNIGDTRTLIGTDGKSYTLAIAGFNHDDISGGKANMTIMLHTSIGSIPFTSSGLTADMYNSSAVYNKIREWAANNLPQEVQNAVKGAAKKFNTAGNYYLNYMYLQYWNPSPTEVNYTFDTAKYPTAGTTYELYTNTQFSPKDTTGNTLTSVWSRLGDITDEKQVGVLNTATRSCVSQTSTNSCACVFGFCI